MYSSMEKTQNLPLLSVSAITISPSLLRFWRLLTPSPKFHLNCSQQYLDFCHHVPM